jgi:DNA topoisomerase-1
VLLHFILSIKYIKTKKEFLISLEYIFFSLKLALRVGNEKDEDEADTVGCCSLRVEHIKLYDRIEHIGENIVEFDFLGKDSIR